MDAAIDLSDSSKALDLSNIRFQLIRLEDTITFNLIERVQFPLNSTIYIPGGVPLPDPSLSLLDWILLETERLHSLIRRYESPDEVPFFPSALHKPFLPSLSYPQGLLHPNTVDVNQQLKQCYISTILPRACARFDRPERRADMQENYGSAAVCDVLTLQALSRRVHFGKFVAEAKFRQHEAEYVAMIRAGDREGLARAITDEKVEEKVLQRLRLKARTYGTDPSMVETDGSGMGGDVEYGKINVEAVVAMYKDHVIPLTKVVEVEYLMQRLKGTQWEQ
ncbi:hypothetical protein ANO11243_085640 [Dothideomycetidae sp. 11243]|nr:hypothetical protein ANO11243_085640 [fungal sp. No.11243]